MDHKPRTPAPIRLCKEGIDTWITTWRRTLHTILEEGTGDSLICSEMVSWMDLYGTFYHSEATLLCHMVWNDSLSLNEAVQAARQMIRAFSGLHLQHSAIVRSSLNTSPAAQPVILIAPLPWTAVHSLCTAGVFLLDSVLNGQHSVPLELIWCDVELCVSLLSHLESNSDNASAGLSTSLNALLQSCKLG